MPFTAYAYGTVDSSIGCVVTVYSTDKIVYAQNLTFTENGYFIYDTSSYKQPDLNKISLNFEYKYDIKKGDIMMIDFVMSRGRYRGFSFNVDAYGETNVGNRGKTFFKNSGSVNGDTEFTDGDLTYDYSFSSQANSSNTFHFENSAPFSYNGTVNIDITLEDFDYTFSDSTLPTINLGVEVRDISSSVESPESGQGKKLLSGISAIIDYIKGIFQSIGELPSKIGSFITNLGSQISVFFSNLTSNLRGWFDNIGNWFTDLGNNIKQWFTNLTNNLKTWFDNIGKWFKDIGDRISGFFSNLWDNISNSIKDVTDSIKQWWNGLIEWFKNLFIIPDGYLEEYKNRFVEWFKNHFGFLYQSIELSGSLVAVLLNIFTNTPDGVITIPQITLPWGGHVIMRETSFSFNDMVNSHSQFKWIFGLIRTASSAIVIVTFVNYAYIHMNEFIKDRKENDG